MYVLHNSKKKCNGQWHSPVFSNFIKKIIISCLTTLFQSKLLTVLDIKKSRHWLDIFYVFRSLPFFNNEHNLVNKYNQENKMTSNTRLFNPTKSHSWFSKFFLAKVLCFEKQTKMSIPFLPINKKAVHY